jgi:hypothetical protein
MLFDCQECGYLRKISASAIGGWSLANPRRCTIDGYCGNNLDRECMKKI